MNTRLLLGALLAGAGIGAGATGVTGESAGQKFVLEKVMDGGGVIWGFDFLSASAPDELIYSERDGKLVYLNQKTGQTHAIAGVPKVAARGQGGLLDVYIDQGRNEIYLTYSEAVGKDATTSLYRGKLSADKKTLSGSRLFQAKAATGAGEHFGSRVALDKDGYIFLGVGERGERQRAQQLDTHQGKILRLNRDGSAPADNPFIGTAGALPEIWSYGQRNPQGLVIDQRGALLEAEFGPRGGDEVNLIQKGANYGWPVATYGSEYWGPSIGAKVVAGTVQPLLRWVPSINPSGIMVYSGKAFPRFEGNLFLAALSGHLQRVVFDGDRKVVQQEQLLDDTGQRYRQVRTGPDGLIYLSTDNGAIFRLKPAS